MTKEELFGWENDEQKFTVEELHEFILNNLTLDKFKTLSPEDIFPLLDEAFPDLIFHRKGTGFICKPWNEEE